MTSCSWPSCASTATPRPPPCNTMSVRSHRAEPASCLEAMDLALRSLGTFFELLAEAFYRWAAQLGQVIASWTKTRSRAGGPLPGMS